MINYLEKCKLCFSACKNKTAYNQNLFVQEELTETNQEMSKRTRRLRNLLATAVKLPVAREQ